MTRVINLIASSNIDRAALAKILERENDKYNIIKPYTTREYKEKDKDLYTFIDEGKIGGWSENIFKSVVWKNGLALEVEFSKDNMIFYSNSDKTKNHHFATNEQVIRKKDNICIVDPKDAEMISNYYKEHNEVEEFYYQDMDYCVEVDLVDVITIFLYADKDSFNCVKCDYFINSNGSIEETKDLIKKLLEE